MAKQRGIKLEVEVPEEELLASVDKEALTKILSNLFANALKYARTYVYLHLSVDEKNEVFTISMSNDGKIFLKPLSNTGTGKILSRAQASD